jgi:phosphate transport system substrate-binding protein
MSYQKNETAVLMSALLITAGLLAGGFWWVTRKSGIEIARRVGSQPNNALNSSLGTPSPGLSSPQPANTSNFASVKDVPTGLFNYGGSTSWAPIRSIADPQVQAANPTFRLRFVETTGVAPGSSSGIRMLIEGELAFAQSSRPLLDREVSRAAVRGFGLKQIPVAIDGLAIAVHPNLNIPGLTLAQLKAIYTNKITNWKQLGGPNLPIKPYSRPLSDGGTVELFVQDILAGQPVSSNVEFVATTTQALQKIAGNPGGIYYASAPEVVPQCSIRSLPIGRQTGKFVPPYREPFVPQSQCPNRRNQLNVGAFQSGQYPITRNMFVIIKQNSQSEQQAGEAYANLLLTEQGQAQITQAGFVRIK